MAPICLGSVGTLARLALRAAGGSCDGGASTGSDSATRGLLAACCSSNEDLEQAAVEQVAEWFQNRDHLGLKTSWPSSAEYKQFTQLPLLPAVKASLDHYRRWTL